MQNYLTERQSALIKQLANIIRIILLQQKIGNVDNYETKMNQLVQQQLKKREDQRNLKKNQEIVLSLSPRKVSSTYEFRSFDQHTHQTQLKTGSPLSVDITLESEKKENSRSFAVLRTKKSIPLATNAVLRTKKSMQTTNIMNLDPNQPSHIMISNCSSPIKKNRFSSNTLTFNRFTPLASQRISLREFP